MNKHVIFAIILIILFMCCGCGARELFSPPAPREAPVHDPPAPREAPVQAPAVVPEIPAPEEMLKAQPTAPLPAQAKEMGYYNFAKVMYM